MVNSLIILHHFTEILMVL